MGRGQGKWEQCSEKQEPVTLWFPGRKYLEEGESLFFFFSGRAGSSLLVVAVLGILIAVASLVAARGL